ncbi:dihydrodipicolinate synthase family protein [Cohnella sp. GCM10020058]|uniref:dihydrodipicolinate synthase family protein n=1 Tax=Cohnella sp. GCM10020058 TaxID=3317330 RepID=UPI003628AED7
MSKNWINAFAGVYVAMYSAYDGQGNVNSDRVRRLARHYVGTGVKGLYVGGSSGEGMLQTEAERKQVLEAVIEEVKGELTVIVHVGANATRESEALCRHAEEVGADAVSAVPSIYYRLSEKAVETHWQRMIDSTSLPFIIYNIPQTTGFSLTPLLLGRMAEQERVIGVKMSGESAFELQQFKATGGDNFLVFNGPDEQYLAGRIMGADGGIGGTYGVMPELFVELDRLYRHGELAEAQALQFEINGIIKRLLGYPSLYGACKHLLGLRGVETGAPRLPLLPIDPEQREALAALNRDILDLVASSK